MPDLPFLDSFDHYDTTHSVQKWATGALIVAAAGRRGTQCARTAGTGIGRTFDSEYSTLYCGGAFKGPGNSVFALSNALSGIAVSMQCVGDGRFYMAGQDPTAPLVHAFSGALATPPVLMDRWYYLEMEAVVASTTISVVFRINEAVVLSETHTLYGALGAHAAWATFAIQGQGGGLYTDVDDVYVDDGAFMGDINIDVMRPNGAGSSSMWTASPAVANWNNVKDVLPDDGATVVTSAAVNDLDLYAMSDIPTGLTAKAIQGLASVTKDSAGLASLKLQYNASSPDLSAAFYPSQTSYIYVRDGRKTLTAGALTSANLNALTFGQIRTA